MPALHKQSWFWSMVATAFLSAGAIVSHSKQTANFETAVATLNARVSSIEASTPKETRWIVDQHTNFLSDTKSDIAAIKGSIRKIELLLARGVAGQSATPPPLATYEP